jgi:hypothetical protein
MIKIKNQLQKKDNQNQNRIQNPQARKNKKIKILITKIDNM